MWGTFSLPPPWQTPEKQQLGLSLSGGFTHLRPASTIFRARTLGMKNILHGFCYLQGKHHPLYCWSVLNVSYTVSSPGSGVPGGGHGPRAQALEGAPAQLVGPNCKKKSRPRQISKVTSLQSAVADAGFTKQGGGAGAYPGGGPWLPSTQTYSGRPKRKL